MKRNRNQRGQAVVELAIFGSIILLGFGILVSHLQRTNDQQYTQMEAFRRALEKACNYYGGAGSGASVQMNLIRNRRYAELGGDYAKGAPQTVSGSAQVIWSVPEGAKPGDEAGEHEPANLVVYRINEDEMVKSYREYVPYDAREAWYFTIEDTTTQTDTQYTGTMEKEEDSSGITTKRTARLKDNLRTNITYTVRQKDSGGGNPENDVIISSGEFWNLEQGIYRDPVDGQYRYSESTLGAEEERERTWRTEF